MSEKVKKNAVRYKPLFNESGAGYKSECSLNKIFFPGCYSVEIDHIGIDVGLPIDDCGDEHYIVGNLFVTDCGTLGPKQNNRVTGQVLVFTTRVEKVTKIYTRTFADGEWSKWRTLAETGMYDKIANTDELLASVEELVNVTKELQTNVDAETSRAKVAEGNNTLAIGNEMFRAQTAEAELDIKLAENIAQTSSKLDSLDNNIASIITKKLSLAVSGYYQLSGKLGNTENAMNTGLVEIGKYSKLRYSALVGTNAAAVCFFDSSKKCITVLNVAGTSALINGVIDLSNPAYADAKYVAVSYYDKDKKFEQYEALLYENDSLGLRVESVEKVKLLMPLTDSGLKVLIFGDSITSCASITTNEQQQTTAYTFYMSSGSFVNEIGETVTYSMWPALLKKYLVCSDLRNYAFGGASYTEREREAGNERQNLSYQIQLALNDVSNPNGVFPTMGNFVPDVIIFALGTNDGTPNDTYDSAMEKTIMSADGQNIDVDATLANLNIANTCEAVRYAFLKVKQAFSQALCLCVLPIQRASTETPGINEVLEKLAKRYSIKVIDGSSELGVVRDLEIIKGLGVNLKDGVHPTDKGQKLFVRMMVNAIKNNYLDVGL